MNTKQTELTPEALDALDKQNTALNAWLSVARGQLSPQAFANLREGLANGALRLIVAAQTGLEGTHVVVSMITTATGHVDQFFEMFLGGEPEEDEPSNETGTPPSLH